MKEFDWSRALVVITFLMLVTAVLWYVFGNSPTTEQVIFIVFGFLGSLIVHLDKKFDRRMSELENRMHDKLVEFERRQNDKFTELERRILDKIDSKFGGEHARHN